MPKQNKTPEEEAAEMIEQLELVLGDLRIIARGKQYTREQAKEQLDGAKLALQYD